MTTRARSSRSPRTMSKVSATPKNWVPSRVEPLPTDAPSAPLRGALGKFADGGGVPWTFPPAEREQPVGDQCGEAPDQHRVDAERRAAVPAWEAEHEPVRGLGEVGDADPLYRRDLADVHR